jgi:hypothetical protein
LVAVHFSPPKQRAAKMWGLLFWWVLQPAVFQSPEALAIQPFSALLTECPELAASAGFLNPALLANRRRFCSTTFEEER